MTQNGALPRGSKCSEEAVLRGFMSNITSGVKAGDPGSIAAYQRSAERLAALTGSRLPLAQLRSLRKSS